MSETTLTSLLEYLYGALTPNNQRWLAEHLIEHAYAEEGEVLKPYTVEELLERAEKGRKEIARGNYVTSEELFRDLFWDTRREPQKQAQQTIESLNLKS